jgi:uncharacterized protein (TIGR02231 family)
MNRSILLCIALLFTCYAAVSNSIKPEFKLNKVTVYLVGAELTYKTKASLPKGRSKVIFSNISQTIAENSVRVKIDNNVKIISVSLENVKVNFEKEIKTKQDSIELLIDQIERMGMERTSYDLERRILTDNITRIGSSQNVPVAELMNATKQYRDKLKELDNIEFKLRNDLVVLNATKSKLEESKNQLLSEQSLSVSGTKGKQLVIEVDANSETSGNIDMSYLVMDAGWSPKYNIRAQSDGSEIELEYRANVYNNSGINWKNVAVTLSTASTETKLIKPELGYAWTMDFRSYEQQNSNVQNKTNKPAGEGLLSNKQLKNDKVDFVNIDAPELTLYMDLDVTYDIPADNEPHMVSVGDFKLPSRYKYFAIPKVDDNVYLIAYVSGWQKLNLIEGESSIYYNGAFLGNSTLNTQFSSAEMEISLGADKGIQISKVKKEDKEGEKTIGTNRQVRLEYHIDVRNNKSKEVEVEITDQVPVSADSDITVEIVNTSEAKLDEQSGKLTWNLKLKSLEAKKLIIEFSVKYPKSKEKHINFTLFRFGRQKVICPKFR